MNNVYIILAVILVLVIVYYYRAEPFTNTVTFERRNDAQFQGINLLGINSNDSAIGVNSVDKCEEICRNNPGCLGYTYYAPGQSCFLMTTGGFVDNRPGYQSGVKLD